MERKRKFLEEEEYEEEKQIAKIFKKADQEYSLEHFCDEILLEVLVNLDSESLYNLNQACERFSGLVREKKLWNKVNFTSKPLAVCDILKRLEFLQITTESLKIRGDYSKKLVQPTRQSFKAIVTKISKKCSLLHTLHFEDVWFDWVQNFRIKEFPCTLRSLTFINCNAPRNNRRLREPKIFTGMDQFMLNLIELRIEYCNWFEVHDLVQFSKLTNLKILSLKGCPKLVNCVPYLSLACRFGFKTLESLDMRETQINDSDLQCFNVLTKLKELYLECPHKDPPADSSTDDDSDDEFEKLQNRFLASYRNENGNPTIPSAIERPGRTPESSSSTVIVAAPMAESSSSSAQVSIPPIPEIQIVNAEPTPSTSRLIKPIKLNNVENFDSNSSNSSMSDSSNSAEDVANAAFSAIIIRNYPNGANETIRSNNLASRMQISMNNNFRIRDLGAPRLIPLERERNPVRLMVVGDNNYPHARYLRYERDHPQFRQNNSLSDRGILGFGIAAPQILQDVVFIRIQQRDPNTYLERLVIRNYKNVTDISLQHLLNSAPKLVYLDVTGTGVTPEGVADFKTRKPDCKIITAFDEE